MNKLCKVYVRKDDRGRRLDPDEGFRAEGRIVPLMEVGRFVATEVQNIIDVAAKEPNRVRDHGPSIQVLVHPIEDLADGFTVTKEGVPNPPKVKD